MVERNSLRKITDVLPVKARGNVYWPDEDSKFLLSAVLDERGLLLDMGCGSGFIAINYVASGENKKAVCVDIDEEALEVAKENADEYGFSDRVSFIRSDLFSNVDGNYDVIAFNPPYLSLDVVNEISRDKAIHDDGVIERFIQEAPKYLNPSGVIFLVTSTDHERSDEIHSLLEGLGWKSLKKRPMGYGEDLILWQYRKE